MFPDEEVEKIAAAWWKLTTHPKAAQWDSLPKEAQEAAKDDIRVMISAFEVAGYIFITKDYLNDLVERQVSPAT